MKVKLVATALDTRQLPLSYETQVYRMVQQLVGNVLKHANAQQLVVQLYWKEQEHLLHINVEDDGDGFDYEPASSKGGMGLQNIDRRVKDMGGTYSIDSAKGKGCSVLIDLPFHHLETLAD
jgi:signal transduction histidine kinase